MYSKGRKYLTVVASACIGIACTNPGNVVPFPDSGSGTYGSGSSGGGGAPSPGGAGPGGVTGGSAAGTDSGDDSLASPADGSADDASYGDAGASGVDAASTDMDVLPLPFDAADAASPPADAPAGDGLSCSHLGCIDVFDCAIYHPVEFGPCGFTQCVNFVCQ